MGQASLLNYFEIECSVNMHIRQVQNMNQVQCDPNEDLVQPTYTVSKY